MTDADRLRVAAGLLDRWGKDSPPEANPMISATAALLRAVADDCAIGLYIVGAESPAAALALADVILGGSDG